MRTSTAFLAGAGTVVLMAVAGLGGGLQIASMINPRTPAVQAAKAERHTTSEPSPNPSPSPHPAAQAATAKPAGAPVTTGAASHEAHDQPAAAKGHNTDQAADDADVKRDTGRHRAHHRLQWADRHHMQWRHEQQDPGEVDQTVRNDSSRRIYDRQSDSPPAYARDDRPPVREDGPPRVFAIEPADSDTPRFRLFGDD